MGPSAASQLRKQWQNPQDIFSLLLILGPDVILQAIARLTSLTPTGRVKLGRKSGIDIPLHLTPVAFSFGWVAFGITALARFFGDHKLMPEAEVELQVINCANGYVRTNRSWLLSRLVRDMERRLAKAGREHDPPPGSTGRVSLMIDVLTADPNTHRDKKPWFLHGVAWFVIFVQLVVAALPWILWRDWSIFIVTAGGTLLALTTSSLPQWRAEKWAGRPLVRGKPKKMAITRGNSHCYVMIIQGHADSWDIEAMASASKVPSFGTGVMLAPCSILWIVLLLSVTGIKEHSWFLVAVGALGMAQNLIITAWPTHLSDLGAGLRFHDSISPAIGYQYTHEEKNQRRLLWGGWTPNQTQQEFHSHGPQAREDLRDVMDPIMALETQIPKAGAALLPIFFPGSVQYDHTGLNNTRERSFWEYANEHRLAQNDQQAL